MPKHPQLLILWAAAALIAAGFFAAGANARVTMYPYISAGATYTDNRDVDAEEEEEDYITTISPGVDVTVTGRSGDLTLSYAPTYAAYLRFPEDNTLRHAATVAATRQMTGTTRLEFANDYLYTEDPLEDTAEPISEVDTTVRRGRETYSANTTELGVVSQFGPEDSLALRYAYYFLENSDPFVEDRDHHRPSITLTYWPKPNQYGTETEVSYTRRYFDETEDYNDVMGRFRLIRRLGPHFDVYAEYTHELTEYMEGGTDYQVYSPVVGFTWSEYANTTFSASFGYFFQDNDDADSESAPVGTIETIYAWDERHSVSLSGAAGYEQADAGAEVLGFSQFYSVTGVLDYQLARRLVSSFSAGYERNVYTDEDPDREDSLWRISGGLTWQPLSWMAVDAGYAYRTLESNIDVNDYTENRVFFNVTLTPRQPAVLSR
jgi:hypothetical protein